MDAHLAEQLLHRSPNANKYDFGHLLIVGGSTGMTGAPLLAAEAALRIGCGLVTIATDAQTVHDLVGKVNEVMSISLPSDVDQAATVLHTYVKQHKVTAMVLGPGLKPVASNLVRQVTRTAHMPLVIDAGGLSAFGGNLNELKQSAAKNHSIVVTPHTGEYARLSGVDKHADMHADAQAFSVEIGVHVVLKGDHTLVAHPTGISYQNKTGNPGMATAGSGDVLAGIIGGLLAQGFKATKATEAGVYLHGLAGDLAVKDKTEPGIIASDIISYLPKALKHIE